MAVLAEVDVHPVEGDVRAEEAVEDATVDRDSKIILVVHQPRPSNNELILTAHLLDPEARWPGHPLNSHHNHPRRMERRAPLHTRYPKNIVSN